ncbi:MAG: CvpA family protein [Azospirillum sp.]|nr:CvpA family protein [Azospirillum sp.]
MDVIVIGVILLSAILAFLRGLVAEALSVGGWVGAAAATLVGFPHLQPVVRQHISSQLAADVVSVVAIFVATLVVLTLVSHQAGRLIRGSGLSAVDRSLGFVFGLVRGAALVCIGYLLLAWLVPPGEQPDWIKEARTRPMVEAGAGLLKGLVPQSLRDNASSQADAAVERARQAVEEQALQGLTTTRPEAPKPAKPATEFGYKPRDQAEIERTINNLQNAR